MARVVEELRPAEDGTLQWCQRQPAQAGQEPSAASMSGYKVSCRGTLTSTQSKKHSFVAAACWPSKLRSIDMSLDGCPLPRRERLMCCVLEASYDVGVLMALLVLPRASKVLSVLAWALAEDTFVTSGTRQR